MKLQLSICAKDLPANPGGDSSFYAVVYNESSSATLGKTPPVDGGAGGGNPSWNTVVSMDGNDDNKKVNVVIYDGKGDSIVTSALFDVTEILASPQKAQAQRTAEATTGTGNANKNMMIAVHVQPEQVAQLHLLLGAKDLPDTDFGFDMLGVAKQMTDPFFELYNGVTNKKLVRSNICHDTLHPTWQPLTLDLNQAFGTLDAKAARVKITLYDKDQSDAKEFLGQVETSVDALVQQSGNATGGIPLVFNRGSLLIHEAKLLPQQAVSRTATKALNAVTSALQMNLGALQQAQDHATTMAASAASLQRDANAANETAVVLEKEQQAAAERQGQAQTVVSTLGSQSKKLVQQQKKAGGAPCTGKLILQLRAENLLDTDLGLLNKTDAVYQVYSSASAGTEMMHRSNIVRDNLNPTWDVSSMDLVKLCQGKLGDDGPFRIAFYDKDGGDDTNFLGHLNNITVNQLLKTSPSVGLPLEKAQRGTVFVIKAELEKYVNLVQQLATVQEELNRAQKVLDETKTHWKTINVQAEQARQVAVEAQEKAEKALDEAEAAQLAVEMSRVSLK